MNVTPPLSAGEEPPKKRLGWHQDSGRLNADMETDPRPRISLKVGYFLTDTREMGRGNIYVMPGSHLQNRVEFPADGVSDPEGAVPIRVPPGSAVFFDRRHLALGEPEPLGRDAEGAVLRLQLPLAAPARRYDSRALIDRCDPIRRQLLGASPTRRATATPRPPMKTSRSRVDPRASRRAGGGAVTGIRHELP